MSQTETTAPADETQTQRVTPFTRVLCAIDGTQGSIHALEQAICIAGPQGEVTLLAVTAVAGYGANRTAAISPLRAERVLDRAAHIVADAGPSFTKVIDPGAPPVKVILQRARQHELLVMGAPRTSWLGGMFVGGVIDAALQSFTTPLLAARREIPDGRRILLASDGSDDSQRLVDLAPALARIYAADVTLLHLLSSESDAHPHRLQGQATQLAQMLPGASELRVEVGGPRHGIVEIAAECRASLILMGARHRTGLRALGGTCAWVIHNAPCSVLALAPAADIES